MANILFLLSFLIFCLSVKGQEANEQELIREINEDVLFNDNLSHKEIRSKLLIFKKKITRLDFDNKQILEKYVNCSYVFYDNVDQNYSKQTMSSLLELLAPRNEKDLFKIRISTGASFWICVLLRSESAYKVEADFLQDAITLMNKFEETNSWCEKPTLYNEYASIFEQEKKYSMAIFYYKKALSLIRKKDFSFKALLQNNIGFNYFHRKQYDKAVYFEKKALLNSERAFTIKNIQRNHSDYAGCKSALAKFQYYNRQFYEARKNALESKAYCEKHELIDNFIEDYYFVLCEIAIKEGDTTQLNHLISEISNKALDKRLNPVFFNSLLVKIFQYLQLYEKEIAVLKETAKDEKMQANIKKENLIGILTHLTKQKIRLFKQKKAEEDLFIQKKNQFILINTILLMVVVFLVFRLSLKRLKNKTTLLSKQHEIDQIEKHKNEIQLKLYESRDKEKRLILTKMSAQIKLQEEAQETFLRKLKEIRKNNDQDVKTVVSDLQARIITLLQFDKNLDLIEEKDELLNDFKFKLKNLHPNLIESEINLCTYSILNLSSKEISMVTNQSSGAIRTQKYKIKKKLCLQPEESLDNYLKHLFQ